jgi:hypothetical protein
VALVRFLLAFLPNPKAFLPESKLFLILSTVATILWMACTPYMMVSEAFPESPLLLLVDGFSDLVNAIDFADI